MAHVHRPRSDSSQYAQVCNCGAVRLRAAGTKKWEAWHVCSLCALRPAHAETLAHKEGA
jgi:hypothetical protein